MNVICRGAWLHSGPNVSQDADMGWLSVYSLNSDIKDNICKNYSMFWHYEVYVLYCRDIYRRQHANQLAAAQSAPLDVRLIELTWFSYWQLKLAAVSGYSGEMLPSCL